MPLLLCCDFIIVLANPALILLPQLLLHDAKLKLGVGIQIYELFQK
jgi:hypothetical protein